MSGGGGGGGVLFLRGLILTPCPQRTPRGFKDYFMQKANVTVRGCCAAA